MNRFIKGAVVLGAAAGIVLVGAGAAQASDYPSPPSPSPTITVIGTPGTGNGAGKAQECQTAKYSGLVTPAQVSADPATRKVWYTEDGSPMFETLGLQYSTPNATGAGSKENLFHGVTVPLAGLRGLSYVVKNNTAFPTAAYDLEVLTTGTAGYTTLVFEPYQQGTGIPVDKDGTFTGMENGKWWSSHIATGPGSQSDPITLAAFSALYPSANVISYGVGQGSNNAGSVTTVSELGFLCGINLFTNKIALPPVFKSYTTTCVWYLPKGDSPDAKDAFKVPQTLVGCGPDVKVPSDCGNSYQVDTEHINNASDQAVLDANVKRGTLRSNKDDQQITVSWKFVTNKVCVTSSPSSSSSSPSTSLSSSTTVPSSTTSVPSITPTAGITTAQLVANTLPFTGVSNIGALLGVAASAGIGGAGVLFAARKRRISRSH